MILVKNGFLGKETVDALNGLIVQKVPIKTSQVLIKVVRKVNLVLNEINMKRQEIMMRHIERDKEGNPVFALDNDGNVIPNRVKIVNESAFQQEINEYLNQEQEINVDKISVSELGDIKIEPIHLMSLEWLVITD